MRMKSHQQYATDVNESPFQHSSNTGDLIANANRIKLGVTENNHHYYRLPFKYSLHKIYNSFSNQDHKFQHRWKTDQFLKHNIIHFTQKY
jgi:hypothetical protein